MLNSLFKNLQTHTTMTNRVYLLVFLTFELHPIRTGKVPVALGVTQEDGVDHDAAGEGAVRVEDVVFVADVNALDVEVDRFQELKHGSEDAAGGDGQRGQRFLVFGFGGVGLRFAFLLSCVGLSRFPLLPLFNVLSVFGLAEFLLFSQQLVLDLRLHPENIGRLVARIVEGVDVLVEVPALGHVLCVGAHDEVHVFHVHADAFSEEGQQAYLHSASLDNSLTSILIRPIMPAFRDIGAFA